MTTVSLTATGGETLQLTAAQTQVILTTEAGGDRILFGPNDTELQFRGAGQGNLYLGGAGMKAQLKYADKRGAPVAVIEGEDERAKDEITLKDLILGAEMSKEIEDNTAWREGQPAQVSVPRARLVEEVVAMLARHRDVRGHHG